MNTAIWIILIVAGLCGVVILLRVFSAPLRLAVKLACNTLLGFAELIVLDFLGSWVGFSLGINLMNAIIAGVLGIPGVLLLILTRWLFGG